MAKNTLTEIHKNKVGTGLLIENDGYISMKDGDNRLLYESIQKINEEKGDEFYCPNPFIVNAVFQKYGIENHNGRIYPEEVLKKQVNEYQKKIEFRNSYGESNHPESSTIDLDRVSMDIQELHWEGHTLVGKLEVITTPGFRKYGICSNSGDIVANLLMKGLQVGVSSRGVGSVTNKFGKYIVGDDYEIICWDFVSDPSTPGAWVNSDMNKLQQFVEQKEISKKNIVSEKKDFSKFEKWLIK